MEKELNTKRRKNSAKPKLFEQNSNILKLYIYVTIVNHGQSEAVIKLMQSLGATASFVQAGEGTANQTVKEILNILDTKKDIIISIVTENKLSEIEQEMNAFFNSTKRNRGVGFAIKMDSIAGVRLYKFLSQTL